MKKQNDGGASTTGIRSKLGPIPDNHFENDAAAAIGEPHLGPEAKRIFDEKIASQNARLAAKKAGGR